MAFAAVQMVVHMVYFLHMTPKSEDGWTLTSLVFTLILVVITLAGSLWVMYHMDTNMMPKHEASQPPSERRGSCAAVADSSWRSVLIAALAGIARADQPRASGRSIDWLGSAT